MCTCSKLLVWSGAVQKFLRSRVESASNDDGLGLDLVTFYRQALIKVFLLIYTVSLLVKSPTYYTTFALLLSPATYLVNACISSRPVGTLYV